MSQAPETALRARLIDALNDEFKAEKITFASDKLHDSLGADGPIGAVYPGPAAEALGQAIVQETTAYVQLFTQWDKQIDPTQAVDPATIEGYAQRVREACRADDLSLGSAGGDPLWFYRVVRVDYPDDPTGNLTRLVATVVASSTNSGIVETQ